MDKLVKVCIIFYTFSASSDSLLFFKFKAQVMETHFVFNLSGLSFALPYIWMY